MLAELWLPRQNLILVKYLGIKLKMRLQF